jgi:hypothetical protein
MTNDPTNLKTFYVLFGPLLLQNKHSGVRNGELFSLIHKNSTTVIARHIIVGVATDHD